MPCATGRERKAPRIAGKDRMPRIEFGIDRMHWMRIGRWPVILRARTFEDNRTSPIDRDRIRYETRVGHSYDRLRGNKRREKSARGGNE